MKQKKQKSHLRVHHSEIPAYPNAADNRYITQKILNIVTAIVSGMGFITAMAILVTMT